MTSEDDAGTGATAGSGPDAAETRERQPSLIERTDALGYRILEATTASSRRAGRVVFGDRTGLALWLGLVVTLALTWRVGFFLTDTYTVVNTLLNLADGRLAVTEIRYTLSLGSQPGLHEYGGRLYGRNYGQAMAAVPLLWLLEALAVVVSPRLLLAGGFSVGVLAFARQAGTLLGRRRTAGLVGAGVAFLVFVLNFALATPLERDLLPLVALQLSTLFLAGLVGVLLYRIIALFHDRRVAIGAGVVGGLATPVGFWATLPKRHVLVALLLLSSVYCFARSRQIDGRRQPWLRGLAYGLVGLIAWVHAFEGFFALAVLVPVDLATAESNGRRQLAIVLLVLLVGLTPMLATNAAISGNPAMPPRLLPDTGAGDVEFIPGTEPPQSGSEGEARPTSGTPTGEGQQAQTTATPADQSTPPDPETGTPTSGDGATTPMGGDGPTTPTPAPTPAPTPTPDSGAPSALGGLPSPLGAILGNVSLVLGFVLEAVNGGIGVLQKPDRLVNIFVRSGRIDRVWYSYNSEPETIELAVLEVAPLLAGLLSVPVAAISVGRRLVRTSGDRLRSRLRSLSAARQTDWLVGSYAVVLAFVYLHLLPLISQITVRYLLPSMVLGVYGIARLGAIRSAIERRPRIFAGSWALVAVGWLFLSPLLLSWLSVALGEALQFHALVNLGTALLVAVAVVGRQLAPGRIGDRHTALSLGVAAGATTAFVLLARIEFFAYGSPALGIVREVAALLPVF